MYNDLSIYLVINQIRMQDFISSGIQYTILGYRTYYDMKEMLVLLFQALFVIREKMNTKIDALYNIRI